MLNALTAVRFDGRTTSGRTVPARLTCTDTHGEEIEVVAKFSAGCDIGVDALVVEAIAAMLAADLGLPVPEPYLVYLDAQFVAELPDQIVADLARRSSLIAFGSRHLPPGYTTWPVGKAIPREALPIAAEIFAYDALIVNSDRRPENPNCLFKGASLAIYDHEAAFFMRGIIGWQPPWVIGSLEQMRNGARHLFFEQLRGRAFNLDRFAGAWLAVTDARLMQYREALPDDWMIVDERATHTLEYIARVRDNLDPALQEVRRVLS